MLGTADYIHKCGFQKAVVGLSGGIDSAVTCAIATAALAKKCSWYSHALYTFITGSIADAQP